MTTSSSGLTGSVTHACRMWVVIGSGDAGHVADQRAPAGGAVDHLAGADRAAVGAHRADAAVAALEAEHLGVGWISAPPASAPRARPQTTASWRMIPPGGWYSAPRIG